MASPLASVVSLALAACGSKPKATAESTQPDTPAAPTLALYDFGEREPATVELPKEIREISGLATSADGRLFGHGDEKAMIAELDLASGAIVKRFTLGAYVGLTGLLAKEEVVAVVESMTKRKALLELNMKAVDAGIEFATKLHEDQNLWAV